MVFERPRKNVDPEDEDAGSPGRLNTGLDGDKFEDESELKDCDLEDMGTVRLLIFLELLSFDSRTGNGSILFSAGISSGAGTGRPVAAATS